MLIDRWDVSHVCMAVDDLEAAMARYTAAFGVRWGPVLTFSADGLVVSEQTTVPMPVVAPRYGAGLSMEGLREVCSMNGGTVGPEGLPVAGIELAHARESSPAYPLWGCDGGREYVHHIAYWVDSVEDESRHLIEQGFELELAPPPGDVARGFGYLRSPGGVRIELSDRSTKEAVGRFYSTGRFDAGAVAGE
jgi:catechol 2,3-dioxygenase-like lactoylglutathione lyase family enzyme